MFTENSELMRRAWYSLSGRWTNPLVATLLYLVVAGASGGAFPIRNLASLVVTGPLTLGYTMFLIERLRTGESVRIELLFRGFNFFANALVAYLLRTLFTMLWTLLFIVPGIMAYYSYSMTFYILADNPEMSGADALRRSKEMMYGHRNRLAYMDLRFLGWYMLCIISFGIVALWVMPYVTTAKYLFYRELAARQSAPEPSIP